MKSVELVNSFNNREVSRDEILSIIKIAESEDQQKLITKFKKIISDNLPSYFFEIDNFFIEEISSGLTGAFDYDYINEESGLNGKVSTNDVYNMINQKIIDIIETRKDIKYTRKWKTNGYLTAINFFSGKPYRGVNQLLLGGFLEPMDNPYYLTFKQINKLKGKIKKGAKGHEAIFYNFLYAKDEVRTYNIKVFTEKTGLNEREARDYAIPFVRYYNLFNGADIDGIDFKLQKNLVGKIEADKPVTQDIELAKLIIDNYPAPKPKYNEAGTKAFYSPSSDSITLPNRDRFETIQDYYRTKFHEYSHSTGHPKRLKRDFSGKFGSKPYAFEELIAEFGATFLSAQAGILWHNNQNHAAYIKGWNETFKIAKDDNKFIIRAAAQAQKLADFVLQPDNEGVFKFLKGFKAVEKKTTIKPNDQKKTKKTSTKPVEKVVKPLKPTNKKPSNDQKKTKKTSTKPVEKVDKTSKIDKKTIDNVKTNISVSNKNLKTSKSVIDVPIKIINIDKARFQNRNNLNETVLNQIVKNYSETKLDPVMLWKDAKGKIFLLAGHHRLEASKRVGKTHIQSKFFQGTEADAIHFAKVESNANRSLETPQERSKIYRDMRTKGISKKDITEKAKEIEGKNAVYILNLSYLNPQGVVLQTLNSFDKNSDQATEKELVKIADWIGEARSKYDLTNAHETEMFNFLQDYSQSSRIRTKSEFLQKIHAIAGAFDYDKNDILNLKRFKYKSDGEAQYDKEYQEIKGTIDTILDKKANLTDRLKNPNNPQYVNPNGKDYDSIIKQLDKVTADLNADLKYYQKKLLTLQQEKGKYINAGSNQAALFGPGKPSKTSLKNLIENQKSYKPEYYKIDNKEIEKLLGKIEIKRRESVAITITGSQGSMKTRFAFQLINAFAKNYKVGHLSAEEHPESLLYINKAKEYIKPAYHDSVDVPLEFDLKTIEKTIIANDVIVIDSFQKLKEINKTLELDKDFRKKYHGKLFVIIFQQTTGGDMRGGSKSQFDGDIILYTEKMDDYRDNYIYNNKNRYLNTSFEGLHYNIFNKKIKPNVKE